MVTLLAIWDVAVLSSSVPCILLLFYTLVLKVNPVHVGILMLVTKFWDAINDPLIGALVDSHKNKERKLFLD